MNAGPSLETLENPPEAFWQYSDDVVRFLDPVFGEPLEPWRSPRCVREHDRLGPGLEFLTGLARDNRLNMSLVVALHGQKEDFDDVVTHCGTLLTNAAAVGIEASWDYQSERLIPEVLLDEANEKRAAFQTRQLGWLRENCSYVLPCEFFAWSDWESGRATHASMSGQFTQRMKTLWGIYETATKNEDRELDELSRNRIRNLAFCALQSVRHTAIPGQFGYWLSRLENAGCLPRVVDAPLVVGRGFDARAEYLRECCGIQAATVQVPHERLKNMPKATQYLPHFISMTVESRATLNQLDVPFGF